MPATNCDLWTSAGLILCASNVNGLSFKKLRDLLSLCNQGTGKWPDFLLLSEPKLAKPMPVKGFTLFHDLISCQHGFCIYANSNFESKLLHADHNSIALLADPGGANILVTGGYNVFSKRHLWRSTFSSICELTAKSDSPVVFGGDLNFNRDSPEHKEIVYTILGGNKNRLTQSRGPTCRGASCIDRVIGHGLTGNVDIGQPLCGSDHRPLIAKILTPSKVNEVHERSFFISMKSDSDIDRVWSTLDIDLIHKTALSSGMFFLQLELSLREVLSRLGFLKNVPTRHVIVANFVEKSVGQIVNDQSLGRARTLKAISSILEDSSSKFSFEQISSALGKAEMLAIPAHLEGSIRRSKSSDHALQFSITELQDIISKLDPSKSCGPSFMSVRMFKRAPASVLGIIAFWFAWASQHGYPEIFRQSKVFGVRKGDGSCRPICVTNVISKCYDLALLNRISPILTPRLPKNQVAYLHGRRGTEEHLLTLSALAEVHDDLVLVFMDFAKAFNTVPNITIYSALSRYGLHSTLLDAVFDALISFRISSFDEKSVKDFHRGVKQGGCSSGLIFCVCLIELSRELDQTPLSRPIFVCNFFLTHIFFADDLALTSLGLSDAKSLSLTVKKWCDKNGLCLNDDKCRILPKSKIPKLWFKTSLKYKYLGIFLTYDANGLSFSRPNSNQHHAHRLSPVLRVLTDAQLFKSIILAFNDGLYGMPFVHQRVIASSSSVTDFCENFKSFDDHIKQMTKDFFNLDRNTLISIPRVTAELGIAKHRFGPSLLSYSSDLFVYFTSLDRSSIAFKAFELGTQISGALQNAHRISSLTSLSSPKLADNPWLLTRPKFRSMAASILVTILASKFSHSRGLIVTLLLEKRYVELKSLIESLLNSNATS